MSTAITNIRTTFSSGKTVEITSDEARELYGQLKLLFAQANENPLVIFPGMTEPTVVPLPFVQPIWIDPRPWPNPYDTIITCLSDGNPPGATFCISHK